MYVTRTYGRIHLLFLLLLLPLWFVQRRRKEDTRKKVFSPYHHHDHHCHRIANMIIMMIASIVVMITAISSSSPVVSIKHEAFAIIFFLECDLEEEKRWRWWNNWSRIKVAKFQSDLPLILSLCSAPQNTFILLILASSALLSSFLLLQSNQINSLQSTHLQHKCSSNNKNQIRRHGLLLPYTSLSLYTLYSLSEADHIPNRKFERKKNMSNSRVSAWSIIFFK